jgi:hypothetical protein
MNLNILSLTAGLIDTLLQWLVDQKLAITIVGLVLLAFLLLLVAVRLFRRSASRQAPAKTHPRPAAATRAAPMVTASSSGWQLVDANGQMVPLQPMPFTIGRAGGNALVLDDPSVAPQHARILHDPGWNGLVIEDLDSPSGILVEGKPTRKNLLQPGMHVYIGRYIFTLNQKAP